MAPNVIKQAVHRPGPLKQSNKPHKGGKGKKTNKGKIDVKAASHQKRLKLLSRQERKNQLNQLRALKKEEVLKAKGRLVGNQAPPVLVTVLSIGSDDQSAEFLENLKSCDDSIMTSESALGCCHLSCSRLKQRFAFLVPKKHDLHSVMDSLKVSEVLILLHTVDPVDDFTDSLISVVISHALPTTLHVLQGIENLNPRKKADAKKLISKSMESRFSDIKFLHADTRQDRQLLLRQIGSQKQRQVGFRDKRSHLLVESADFEEIESSPHQGILKVSGYVRGQPLNVNGLIHLPGWGTYQMSRVIHKSDPHPLDGKCSGKLMVEIVDEADPELQESLQSEVVPDPLEGEQTWPTEEELREAELEMQPKKTVKKVAEGTSEYQASWIVDGDESEVSEEDEWEGEQDMESDEDENVEESMDDTESVAHIKDENYDNDLDMDEEKKTLVRFKEERMNQMFPDELDTPMEQLARNRFARYRGLKNYASSPWDPMENLPLDYARIYRFENFKQTKKKVLKSQTDGALPGQFVTVHLINIPRSVYDNYVSDQNTLIVYGLLPHEQKMSVINAVIRKHPKCPVPVKSKDTLIFHIGYTRFTCRPIFSEHKTGNKFKLERFLPADNAVVASFFSPVMFPPASVVIFRQKPDGSHELVATGSLLDVNPNRVIVKRILLSGHPFKIFKRTAVVRYMFFNKEDIDWFKCVELRTKCGRKGHIRESLGSHGHMKCVFDKQLPSQDVVLMALYKRVFPKWTYDPYVCSPVVDTHSTEDCLKDM